MEKETEDKLIQLDDRKVLGLVGEVADRNQFGEYVHKNLELTRYKTGNELSTKEAANFIRYRKLLSLDMSWLRLFVVLPTK